MYELQKKVGLLKGKMTPETSKELEARVAVLEAKIENSSNESLFVEEKPKANKRNNQPLTEMEVESDRDRQTLDG